MNEFRARSWALSWYDSQDEAGSDRRRCSQRSDFMHCFRAASIRLDFTESFLPWANESEAKAEGNENRMTQPKSERFVEAAERLVKGRKTWIYFMWMGRGGDEEQVEQRMFLYPSWLLKKVKVGKMHFWQSLASFSENNDGPVLCGRTVFECEWELSWSCQCFSPPPSFNPHQNLHHCMSEWRNKTMFDNCFRLMKSMFEWRQNEGVYLVFWLKVFRDVFSQKFICGQSLVSEH